MGEHHRVPVDEGRHAAHAQTHARRDAGQRGQQRDGLEARLGEQAVADPHGVEHARGFPLDREVDEIANGDLAKHDRPVREDESDGWLSHDSSS
jgi:hypothetical protein